MSYRVSFDHTTDQNAIITPARAASQATARAPSEGDRMPLALEDRLDTVLLNPGLAEDDLVISPVVVAPA